MEKCRGGGATFLKLLLFMALEYHTQYQTSAKIKTR